MAEVCARTYVIDFNDKYCYPQGQERLIHLMHESRVCEMMPLTAMAAGKMGRPLDSVPNVKVFAVKEPNIQQAQSRVEKYLDSHPTVFPCPCCNKVIELNPEYLPAWEQAKKDAFCKK